MVDASQKTKNTVHRKNTAGKKALKQQVIQNLNGLVLYVHCLPSENQMEDGSKKYAITGPNSF